MKRRTLLKGMTLGVGTVMGSSLIPDLTRAFAQGPTLTGTAGVPKRIIFFLQNNGFDPKTCLPTAGVGNDGSLAKAVLPEPIEALDPFKDRLHIITGLHGRHTSPAHSPYLGALGGYRGGDGVPRSTSTIDYELSRVLPETILPHLCIRMDSMESMRGKPTVASLSASGASQPIFMHSNPNHLFQLLYGGIATGDIRKQHEVRSGMLDRIEAIAAADGDSLPALEEQRYGQYVDGFGEINGLQERLGNVSDNLRNFAAQADSRYTKPEFETDWHDCLLDLGISALKLGITNVLTVGSGRGAIFGAWKGLGIEEQGHMLGHLEQPDDPIWIKIRQYNMRMLV